VLFSLPDRAIAEWFPNGFLHKHLAYVEWFSPFPKNPDPNHELFKMAQSFKNGQRYASIVPVNDIYQSVHLFLGFFKGIVRATSDNKNKQKAKGKPQRYIVNICMYTPKGKPQRTLPTTLLNLYTVRTMAVRAQ
jgi:hypothetical protein